MLKFGEFIGGSLSLKTIKEFNRSHNLYDYRLMNYFEYVDKESLVELASIPCATTGGFLDSSNIRIAKIIRNSLNLDEELTCNTCLFKDKCTRAGVKSKVQPTVAEFTRFLYARVRDPPIDEGKRQNLDSLLDKLPAFINNLKNYPVQLKRIEVPKDQPIKSENFVRKTKKVKRIPKKLEWQPKPEEIQKQDKLQRRKEKQLIENEISLMIKRTAKLVKKNRKSRRLTVAENRGSKSGKQRSNSNNKLTKRF